MAISFTVLGQVYSMKNSKTLTMRGGKLRTIKHAKALQFQRDFCLQVPSYARKGIASDVAVTITIHYPSRLQDLDESIILDLLQPATETRPGTGVILNDRQVKEKHVFWALDKERPRSRYHCYGTELTAPPFRCRGEELKGGSSED